MNNCYRSRFLLLIVLLLSCAAYTQAQSGRRATTPPPTPSVSGARTVEKPAPQPVKLRFLVGVEERSPFLNVPYYLSDTVMDNCVRRLGDAANVIPTAIGRGIDRVAAVRRARTEKDAFVVWLQVESDALDSGRQQKDGPDELYVRYTVFEPQTGKARQSGRTRHSIYKTSRGGVATPTSRNGASYSEYALKQAAREAAERILEAFEIKVRDEGW